MDKLFFSNKTPEEIINTEPKIINFVNLYSVYLFKKQKAFADSIKDTINFADGKILSVILRTKQTRGPTFTYEFLKNEKQNKKHFFIGLEKQELEIINKKFPNLKLKNLDSYQLPFIQGIEFPQDEIKKIFLKLRKFKPDYIWVCVGNPKQEILSNQLFKQHKTFYFNVGAATDFLLGKKKESPFIFRKVGLEWFYRLITDFKYSKKKVWRSFVGLWYLVGGGVVVGVREI